MSQGIKTTLDFLNVGKIINLPDGVDPQDAATVAQLATGAGTAAWGGITGSIRDQTDLIDGGKILTSLLPALAITDTSVVSSEADMLALTAETGDIAVRTDETKTYILKGTDPSVLTDWELLLTPTGGVVSVFGRTGTVTAQSGDYSFSLISGTAAATQGGTGLTSYATGDLIYASATNVLSKLAASTDGKVLTLASGVPSWVTPAGGLPSQTGNSGKFLTTDGSSASWGTSSIAWGLTGTSGTDGTGTTNFLGTTDNKALIIKTNNTTAFTVTTGGAIGFGNSPSRNLIYVREGGFAGAMGIGINSLYGMEFFCGTNLIGFTWTAGGTVNGPQLMRLNGGGLNVYGNISLTGSLTGTTDLGISGHFTLGTYIDFGVSYSQKRIYFRHAGSNSDGIGQDAYGYTGTQFFARPGTGWSFNDAGDYQTNGGTPLMYFTAAGLRLTPGIRIGSLSLPTSKLQIGASSGSTNDTPLKLTAGTNVSTPEDGAFEYDGTHLYFTIGTTRHTLI